MLIGDKEYSELIRNTKDQLRRNTKHHFQWFLQSTSELQQEVKKLVSVLSLQAALQAEDADV